MEEDQPPPDQAADAAPTDQSRTRAPQNKMTEADKALLVRICMRDDCRRDGKIHVPSVCKVTGYSYALVSSFISRRPYLNAQREEAKVGDQVPTDATVIDRPPGMTEGLAKMETFSKDQWDEYQALLRQQRKFDRGDWEKLGIVPEDAEILEQYGRMGVAPTSAITNVLNGQLFGNVVALDKILKKTAKKILDGDLPPETDKDGVPRDPGDVQRDWQYNLYAGMGLQMQMTMHVHKIKAMAVRVAADMQRLNPGGVGGKKNHFKPRGT